MGYPTIPSRDALGPTKENYLQEEGDPRYCENAGEANLIRHQLTGLGFLGDLVKVVLTTGASSGAMVLERHKYVWDVDEDNPADDPVLARTGAGTFTIQLPAFGTDEMGNEVPIEILDCEGHVMSSGNYKVNVVATSATLLTMYVRNGLEVLTDDAVTIRVKGGR